MYANDEHLLVIGTVEDPDPAARGQAAGRAPQKIVLQFLGAGLCEIENLAALGIDPVDTHMADGAIPCRRHPCPEKSAAGHSGSEA